MSDRFIPATMARPIGNGISFRPIRSWHSATYAGEKLEIVQGDRSGCARKEGYGHSCSIPLSVTHRLYWHESAPEKTVSAFLSYPNGLGCSDEYFWETHGITDDVERYFGDAAEAEMEIAIKAHFLGQRAAA